MLRDPGWSLALLGLGTLMLAMWAAPRVKRGLGRARVHISGWPGRRGARAARHGAAVVRDVARDAEELATRLAAAIDAKAERLERLIRAADDRLAALEQAAAEGMLGAQPTDATQREPMAGRIGRAVGGGSSATFEADPVARRVHELADQGKSAREIAHSLGEHVGKVQLILALRG